MRRRRRGGDEARKGAGALYLGVAHDEHGATPCERLVLSGFPLAKRSLVNTSTDRHAERKRTLPAQCRLEFVCCAPFLSRSSSMRRERPVHTLTNAVNYNGKVRKKKS